MIKNGYHQESLRSECKCVKSFPENFVLKPRQISVLEEMKIPTERKKILGCRKIMWRRKNMATELYQI